MKNSLKYVDTIPKYMQSLSNIKNASNTQYEWLYTHGCQHRHRYTSHFSCFLKDFNIQEKIGFFDIETSNLKANFGIILCWCILSDDDILYEDWITLKDIKQGIEDKRVVENAIDTMKKFDRISGHYSSYFDLPFLRTRALIHGVEFPEYGKLYHTDVWKMAKKNLCLHSNRQDCVSEAILGATVKTRIDVKAWRQSMIGNKDAMKEVVDHCEKDVTDLKSNFYKLLPYVRLTRTSI